MCGSCRVCAKDGSRKQMSFPPLKLARSFPQRSKQIEKLNSLAQRPLQQSGLIMKLSIPERVNERLDDRQLSLR